MAGPFEVWPGAAEHGVAGRACQSTAGQVPARPARPGKAGPGKAWYGWAGTAAGGFQIGAAR
jgi:hypothetical protein